jgi:hypothetical protein
MRRKFKIEQLPQIHDELLIHLCPKGKSTRQSEEFSRAGARPEYHAAGHLHQTNLLSLHGPIGPRDRSWMSNYFHYRIENRGLIEFSFLATQCISHNIQLAKVREMGTVWRNFPPFRKHRREQPCAVHVCKLRYSH